LRTSGAVPADAQPRKNDAPAVFVGNLVAPQQRSRSRYFDVVGIVSRW
jgi:hypothetical protein